MRLTEHDARGALDSLMAAHQADWARLPAPAHSRFTRDAIVAAIHLWVEQHGAPPTVFDWDPAWARRRGEEWRAERFEQGDWPTLAVVKRQFGNMSKALFHAGLRPRRGPVRARAHLVSDGDVLDAIRRWTERYGEPPAITDWSPSRARRSGQEWRAERYHAGDWPSVSTVVRRFGTFTAAVRAAGLPPRPRGRHMASRRSLDDAFVGSLRERLAGESDRCGPSVLAARVRAVADARGASDSGALRGALMDLAAAAVSWADGLEEAEPLDERRAA
jgi:HNH endonuclease